MPVRLTQEQFLEKARAVHGDKYDYSQAVYESSQKKVTIICPKHGAFRQQAGSHLRGVGCPLCGTETVRSKIDYEACAVKRKATCRQRYGVDNPMQTEAARASQRAGLLEKYGVENISQSEAVIERRRQTNLARYGATSYAGSQEGKARIEATMLERYGAKNFMQSEVAQDVIPSMVEKARQTQRERFGADHYTHSEEYRANQAAYKQAELEAKRQNHTFNSSGCEDLLYKRLTAVFGVGQVIRQYQDERYPYACDFYVKDRDLFIELNASWTHGGRWWQQDSSWCRRQKAVWQDKAALHAFYKQALDTWLMRDTAKRAAAELGRLNYLVFWDVDLKDVDLWVACGCPDGQDWEREYSWIPERVWDYGPGPDRLSLSNLTQAAKAAQWPVFYARELALWGQAAYRSMPIEGFLYANRWKYLGKKPEELTTRELLRGFTISGCFRGYSAFDASLMDRFVQKYQIQSIYDPCAGWGERLLYCCMQDVSYTGVDINDALAQGYEKLIQSFGTGRQRFLVADSAFHCPSERAQAIVTCPPYGPLERYTESGAENLSYEEFLVWWRRVVELTQQVEPVWFAFQINRKYRDAMAAVVLQAGYELEDEYFYESARSSHLTRDRSRDRKKERESLLIFRRRNA